MTKDEAKERIHNVMGHQWLADALEALEIIKFDIPPEALEIIKFDPLDDGDREAPRWTWMEILF